MVAVDLYEKLKYSVDEMHRTISIINHINDDHIKRLFARRISIRLDDFLKLYPQWKNQLKKQFSANSVKNIEELTARLSIDYEEILEKIRDKTAAHRINLDLKEQYDVFQSLQFSEIKLIVDDCTDLFNAANTISGNQARTFPSTSLSMEDAANVQKITIKSTGVKVTNDDLSLGRANHITILHTGPFQQRAGQVVGLIESISKACDVANVITESREFQRDIELQVLSDTISLYDAVFIGNKDFDGKSVSPAIEVWDVQGCEAVIQNLHNLKRGFRESDITLVREIRNKIGAHLDKRVTLEELLKLVDEADTNIINRFINQLIQGVRSAMNQVIFLRTFLAHGQILKGAIGLAQDYSRPFDDF